MSDTSAVDNEQQYWREADRRRIQRTRRILVGVLVFLVILLLIASYALIQIFQPISTVASTKEAKGVTWVRSIYGWGKATDQQFWGPQGTAIGPDGIVWATTQGQNRVVGFNPDGSLNTMLYQGPNGDPKFPNAFSYPTAVAVDPAGLIYIADQPKSKVWVVNRDNKVVRSIFVPTPSAIAVSKERLVVGSASGFVIMTPSGSVVKVVGTQGKGIDQFEAVRGVTIANDGTIYVSDQFNNRISAYDKNGKRKWIVSTGKPGNEKPVSQSIVATESTTTANMQIPAGMTIDGAGRLIVVDPFGFDIAAFDTKAGKLLAKYGLAGTIDGQFVYPSSVAYDPSHDWFSVADTGNARVQLIRLPDSGGTALAAARRSLSGPLRACLIPLALMFLAIVAGIIYRLIKRRKKRVGKASQGDAPAVA